MNNILDAFRNDNRKKELNKFLSSMNIGNLSSSGQGIAELAIIFYVFDGTNIYFKSRTTSNHSNNLKTNEKASFTAYFQNSNYKTKYGAQLRGRVKQILNEELMQKVVKLYGETFDGSTAKLPSIKELCSSEIQSTFYQFSIDQFKIVDENQEQNRTMLKYEEY